MQVFLAEKPFIGCDGLEVTDEMRVTIAAQACLLILNRRTDYFANLRQILVYPGAFLVDRVHTDGAGVLQEQRQVLSGESWSQGQVILSWDDVVDGASVVDDGRNVVIHEFAHQLDQQNGHGEWRADPGGRVDTTSGGRGCWGRSSRGCRSRRRRGSRRYSATTARPIRRSSLRSRSEVFFEQPRADGCGASGVVSRAVAGSIA